MEAYKIGKMVLMVDRVLSTGEGEKLLLQTQYLPSKTNEILEEINY